MTRAEALAEIDDILEQDAGTLTGAEALASLEGWDSVATLSFLAMADEKANLQLTGAQVAKCQTVDDLVSLLGVV